MNALRLILMIVAVACGLGMSAFYEWSGEDQSRAAPVVRWIALGLLIANVLLAVYVIVFGRRPDGLRTSTETGRVSEDKPEATPVHAWPRFGIAHVLLITTVVGLIAASVSLLKWHLGSSIALALLCYAGWLIIRRRELRLPVLCLLMCMWGPFLWLLRWPELHAPLLAILMMLMDLPSLLAAMWIGMLLKLNMNADSGIGAVSTAIELAVGLCLIQFGNRRGLIFTISALTLALYSSFVLQALFRM